MSGAQCDQRASEVDHGLVVLGDRLPADEEGPEAVVPTVCALHDPSSWPATDAANQWLLTAAADMRDDSALPDLPLDGSSRSPCPGRGSGDARSSGRAS